MNEIENILPLLMGNRANIANGVSKGIINVVNYQTNLVTIDTETKCAYFHGDFPRLAQKIPQLESFIEYLKQENYQTNLN